MYAVLVIVEIAVLKIAIMTWEIPDHIAKGRLFQRAVLVAETDKLCVTQF